MTQGERPEVRGRAKRRLWLIAPAFLVVLLLALVLFRQPIGRYIIGRTILLIGRALRGSVTCEQIQGDVFSAPRLVNVRLRADRDSAKVAELGVKYDLLALLRGRIVLAEARIVEPVVWLSPRPSQAPAETTAPSFPNLVIRRLAVTDGRVHLNGTQRAESLNIVLGVTSSRSGMAVVLESLSCRATQERLTVQRLVGQGRITRDSLVLTGVDLRSGSSRLMGAFRMAFRPNGTALDLESLSLSLPEVVGWPGRVSLRGTAASAEGTQQVDAKYAADGIRWRDIDFPRLSGTATLVDSALQVEVGGADEELGAAEVSVGLHLGSGRVSGSAVTSGVAVGRFEPGLADFRLDARVDFSGTIGSLFGRDGADSVDIFVAGKVAELGVDTIVAFASYAGRYAELHELRLEGPAGRMQFAGRARRDRVIADCRLEDLDLALVEKFAGVRAAGRLSGAFRAAVWPDSWSAQGRLGGDSISVAGASAARAAVDVDLHSAGDYSGRIAFGAESLVVGGFALTSAQFIWTGPEFEARFDRPEDRLRLSGDAQVRQGGFECSVELAEFATSAETLTTSGPFRVTWRDESLRVEPVRITVADGTVEAEAVVVAGAAPWLRAQGRGLNLRKLQKLFRIETEFWGTADFDVSGSDTLDCRLAGVDLQAPEAGMVLKRLDAELAATSSGVLARSIRLVHRVDTSVIAGRIDYALGESLAVTNVDLTGRFADPGTWVFWYLRGNVDINDGLIYGDVRLSGSLLDPRMSGRARLVKSTVFIPSINATVSEVNAEMTLKGDRVLLDKLSGESGRGTVLATGFADIGPMFQPDSIRYRVRASGASLNPMADVYAIGGADVSVAWAPHRPFELAGSLNIDEAVVTIGFGTPAAPAAPGSDSFCYDLQVKADRGVWLRNRDADIELAVDLSLRRTMTEQTYSGRLESRQGSVYYLDHTLRVTRGVITFENVSTLDPVLDIAAELPVHRTRSQNGGDWPERILLTLGGTLGHPSFSFSSDPPVWDANQIAGYLSLNVPIEELAAMEQKEAVTQLLSNRLLGYFQTQVTKRVRNFIALDYLEFESGLGTGTGARVTVGKYVGRKLYVSYTQTFASQFEPAFTVEYYLNRRNEILAERSADGRYSVRYRLKLRY